MNRAEQKQARRMTQRDRKRREAAIVKGLEVLRVDDPKVFRSLLRLLARLVAKSRKAVTS